MDTIKIEKRNTKMIAHRGLSGLETENSIPAFTAAGNRSYYGIETDVHRTADGQFVIIHDRLTERVSPVCIDVEASAYETVRSILLRDMCPAAAPDSDFAAPFWERRDLIIPSLAEYVRICKKYEKKCILELKGEFASDALEQLIQEIRGLDYLKDTVFISFHLENLEGLRRLLPKQALYYLTGEYNDEILDALTRCRLHLDICHTALTKEIVDVLHSKDILVNCWTCDDRRRAEELAAWGVDYITSNILE